MSRDDDDDRRVVYVERDGGSGLKVFLLGALMGAGLALLYAPQSGEQTRRDLKRRMRKARALAEEKLGDLTERFSGEEKDLAGAYREAMGEEPERLRTGARPRRPGRRQGRAGAPPGRGARAPPERPGRRRRGDGRLSAVRFGGWHRSVWGFMRRTLQAADENNVPFLASALTFDALLAAVPFILLLLIALTYLAELQGGASEIDIHQLLAPFLPPHVIVSGHDPFAHRGVAARRHRPEPLQDHPLRHSQFRLVQHPPLRRYPDLAQFAV